MAAPRSVARNKHVSTEVWRDVVGREELTASMQRAVIDWGVTLHAGRGYILLTRTGRRTSVLALALQATLPVFITILVAVWFANRWGREFLWITLGFVALMLTLWWGLARPDGPFVERYMVPLLIYTPPLLIAGIVLQLLGRRRWKRAEIILPLATTLALSNLLMARFFFTAGCVAKFWGCPELAPLLDPWD